MDRRGITTIVLWIFIMVAGGVILLFFFLLTEQLYDRGQQSLAQEALQQVDTIIQTQQHSPDTFDDVNVPESTIELTCLWREKGLVISEMRVGGFQRPLQHDMVVGRDMTTSQLRLFSRELEIPYDIGNILYVTGENDFTAFSYPSDLDDSVGRILDELPDQMSQHILDAGDGSLDSGPDAGDTDTYRVVRFVQAFPTGATGLGDLFPYRPTDASDALYILVSSDRPHEHGGVRLYRMDDGALDLPSYASNYQEVASFEYTGVPMLLALIWQGDEDRAACLTEKLAIQLSRHTALQRERLGQLSEYSTQMVGGQMRSEECAARYGTSLLSDLEAVPPSSRNDQDIVTFEGIHEAVRNVAAKNEGMLRGVRCASIY